MSNTELLTEFDLKKNKIEEFIIPETIRIDSRSHEMLLVLNEVFDSVGNATKS